MKKKNIKKKISQESLKKFQEKFNQQVLSDREYYTEITKEQQKKTD